ncbi:MAG: hypothetical protein S4CHLAM81_12720 [Chlamydiales bacterium]|nr:hypothetical protein [Chlamydiales bacterium]MCH9636047.1 hypothetical protein [Chlamydiales bacterium]MCH9704187.1 hypothetical protein [Chlamydiota bacterium]
MSQKNQLMNDGKYTYGFTDAGMFTLLDKKGEPLYPKGLPLLDRVLSHLIYITIWALAILITALFCPIQVLRITNPLLMTLLIINLFFLGCRFTSLCMISPLKPLIFPPLWMRITRDIAKGAGIEALQKHGLEEHEGLLANLKLASSFRDSIALSEPSPDQK